MSRRAPLALAGAGWAGGVLLLGAVALLADRQDRRIRFYTADTTDVLEGPIYAGVVSNIGVLAWWTGAVAALLGGAVLRQRRSPAALPLLLGGILTGWLALDDFFVVHEELLPDLVGVPEKAVYGAYALALLAYVIVFRRFFRGPRAAILVASGVLFAASIGFDLVAPGLHLLEDGAKLLGAIGWAALLAGSAADELTSL